MMRAIYAGAILLAFAASDAGALESSTCLGTDFDLGQTRSPTKLLTDCKVNGVENAVDAQSYTAHFDKGEKFHRTADADVSLLDGPVTIDVEICNLSGVVGRLDLEPKTPREMLIPPKTCRPVGAVSKLGATGGASDRRSEWFGILFRREVLLESARGPR